MILMRGEWEPQEQCWSCAYRGENPGSAHIRCEFDWRKSANKPPTGHPHGIKNGWYIFPVNYDPTWMLDRCEEWTTERDPSKIAVRDPLSEIFGMLGSVGRF